MIETTHISSILLYSLLSKPGNIYNFLQEWASEAMDQILLVSAFLKCRVLHFLKMQDPICQTLYFYVIGIRLGLYQTIITSSLVHWTALTISLSLLRTLIHSLWTVPMSKRCPKDYDENKTFKIELFCMIPFSGLLSSKAPYRKQLKT